MKRKFLKGDSEFSIQVFAMVVFGLVVAIILFVLLASKKGPKTTEGSYSSLETIYIFSLLLAIIISNHFKKMFPVEFS